MLRRVWGNGGICEKIYIFELLNFYLCFVRGPRFGPWLPRVRVKKEVYVGNLNGTRNEKCFWRNACNEEYRKVY